MESAVLELPTPSATFGDFSPELQRDITQTCKMLADPTRLKIVMYLVREKELHVTALCDRLGQSQPAVSHHLALLKSSGLIELRREGKHNYYSLCKGHFHRVMDQVFRNICDPEAQEVRIEDFVLTYNG